MKHWLNLLSVCLLTLVLVGCGKPQRAEQQNQSQSESAAQTQEPAFDLKQVQQAYKGVALSVLDISERNKDGRNAIAITLSVPLDPSVNHQDHLQLSDEQGKTVEGAWQLSGSGKIAWFDHTEPAKKYRIKVFAGLTAGNGMTLTDEVEMELKTRDLAPTVSFNTGGTFLTKGASGGLPLITVNINEVNIDFFRIKDDKIQAFLSQLNRYYWRKQDVIQHGELVYSGRYSLDAPKNTRTERTIDIDSIAPLQQSGVYLAVLQAAGTYDDQKLLWFTITDLGLHARFYQGQIDVHVSSLKTGKPLAGIDVSLYNDKHAQIKTIQSNADGVAGFVGMGNNVRLISAGTKDQYSMIQIRKPALDLSEFDLGERPHLPVELFIYAPRDLYRPGEVVDFNALIRDGDGNMKEPPVLTAQIVDPLGAKVEEFQWRASQLGYYHHQWQLPVGGKVGNWQLEVTGPFEHKRIYAFKVEDFMPQRMKLTFNNGDENPLVSDGKTLIEVPVKGEYLYGAPGSGNRVSTNAYIKQWRNPIEQLKNYAFGDIRSFEHPSYPDVEDITLDHLGEGILKLSPLNDEVRTPLEVSFIASLYESGGRPVNRAYSALIWPQPQMFGIRASFDKSGPKENSQVNFDIVKASSDGTLHSAKGVEVRLVKEDRQYFWVHSNSRGWYYDYSEKEYVEMTKVLDLEAGAHRSAEFHVGYGRYRLEVSQPGTKLISSVRFFAGEDWYARWRDVRSGAKGAHPDKITMALDKPHYVANDVAKVEIVPPESGEGIVLVEGDGPLWFKRVYLDKAGTTVEIPVEASWQQHNLYVSAVVFRKADGKKAIAPKRSFGMVHLPLDRADRKLNIEIETPDKWLPQQTVEAKLNIQGASDDNPVFVTLAAVDVGVLNINDFVTPDPFEHFFGRRAYTIKSRDIYNNLIELSQADNAKLKFGGDDSIGGKKALSKVKILSLFSGAIEVKDGKANIPLALPDFNGKVRLMALAFGEHRFGSAEKDVTVASPVVTQLSTPRFLAKGDKSSVALDVSNLSGIEQQLELKFSVKGPVQMVEQNQTLTLSDKQKQTLVFDVDATGIEGLAEFELTLRGLEVDGQSSLIRRQWPLAVRPAYPALTSSQRISLKQGEVFSLDKTNIKGLLSETVNGLMSVSNKVEIDLSGHHETLLQYPYRCLEQTTSRLWAMSVMSTNADQRPGIDSKANSEREKEINQGFARLASLQLKNGGFGLWDGHSPEQHWLTAYVADYLVLARQMGISVPPELYYRAQNRLSDYLTYNGRFIDEHYSEDSKHYNFAYKAYAAYVLSLNSRARLANLRHLYNKQMNHDKTGLPSIHLGLALNKMGDKKRGDRAIDLGLKVLEQAKEQRRYYGDYGSLIRDRAVAIELLMRHDVAVDEAILLAKAMADDLVNTRWFSTQERRALLSAGIALSMQTSKQWFAEFEQLGLRKYDLKLSGEYKWHLNGERLISGLTLTSKNPLPLFVNSRIIGYGEQPPEPMSDGLSVERQWFDKDGKLLAPQSVQVGDLVLVHLRVGAQERTPNALLVDLLPSGFELENQNLKHAVKLDNFKVEGKTLDELSAGNGVQHMEYRDDRFVAALEVQEYRDSHVFYLMRAVTPGAYIVPPTYLEDMYKPQNRAVGETIAPVSIKNVSSQ